MRKIVALIMLCVVTNLAYAQSQTEPAIDDGVIIMEKPVKCGRAQLVLQVLEEKYDEKQVWVGVDAQTKSNIALLMNRNGTTWTMIQYNNSIACILAAGTQSSPM